MTFVQFPIGVGADASAPEGVGTLSCYRSCLLPDVLEAIWDCDIPDGEFAKSLTIKCAPSTAFWLIIQYRALAEMRQGTRLLPNTCAIQIRSQAVTVRPTGALGVIIVCLRADAASRIIEAPLREFANANIHLESLFSASELAMCNDILAEARTSKERIAGIQSCLLRHLRPHTDSLASCAALHLRSDPTMQMHSLAARLGFSVRHVARVFNTIFGITPKRFARLARFQQILSARRNGLSWAQVAHTCGLADQAHLVKEFQDIVGESPTEFFTHELHTGYGGMDEANLIVQHARPTVHSVTES